MHIYIDIIFLINVIMNTAILWATARFVHKKYKPWRLFLAGGLGAVYIVLAIVLRYGFLQAIYSKALVSIAMVYIAFAPLTTALFLRLLAYFYLIALVAGGTAFGIFYLTGDTLISVTEMAGTPWAIIAGVLMVVVMSKYGWGIIQRRLWNEFLLLPLTIHYGDKTINVDSLVDTGNRLRDPLTDLPVIIVEHDSLRELLPETFNSLFEDKGEKGLLELPNMLAGNEFSSRFRVIPFSSLGIESGMLCGFRPDWVEVEDDGRMVLEEVIVGIYGKKLSEEGLYSALLNPEIFSRATVD